MTTGETNAAVSGSYGTIELGGRTYLVGPMNDKDSQTIANFLRQRMKSQIASMQADPDFALLPPETQKQLILEAAEKKFRTRETFTPQEAADALASKQGVQFMAWILIRRQHPEFTLEQAEALITDENKDRVSLLLEAASGLATLGN